MNIEYGSLDEQINNKKRIKLTYFDVVGDQKLVVDGKEHILKNGLSVVLDVGSKYRIDSLDKNSRRVFSKKVNVLEYKSGSLYNLSSSISRKGFAAVNEYNLEIGIFLMLLGISFITNKGSIGIIMKNLGFFSIATIVHGLVKFSDKLSIIGQVLNNQGQALNFISHNNLLLSGVSIVLSIIGNRISKLNLFLFIIFYSSLIYFLEEKIVFRLLGWQQWQEWNLSYEVSVFIRNFISGLGSSLAIMFFVKNNNKAETDVGFNLLGAILVLLGFFMYYISINNDIFLHNGAFFAVGSISISLLLDLISKTGFNLKTIANSFILILLYNINYADEIGSIINGNYFNFPKPIVRTVIVSIISLIAYILRNYVIDFDPTGLFVTIGVGCIYNLISFGAAGGPEVLTLILPPIIFIVSFLSNFLLFSIINGITPLNNKIKKPTIIIIEENIDKVSLSSIGFMGGLVLFSLLKKLSINSNNLGSNGGVILE